MGLFKIIEAISNNWEGIGILLGLVCAAGTLSLWLRHSA